VIHPLCEYGDALWSDASDYTVRLTADSTLSPASTGQLISSSALGDITLHRIQAEGARDFALVLTSDLAETELQTGSHTFRAWFSSRQTQAATQALTHALTALDLYTDLLGPLPFDEIDLVEVPLYRAAGVEFTGLILLSTNYSMRSSEAIYAILVSHEMAHQWFYATVGSDPVSEAWLDEGPATFLSNIFLDHIGRTLGALSERELWEGGYGTAQANDPTAFIGAPSCEFRTSSTYSSHVYGGAAHFLQTIRDDVGDAAFFAGLRTYYESHIGEIGTTQSLLASFAEACECDLSEIYEAFGFDQPG